MGTRRYRNGFVGRFYDESYSPDQGNRLDFFETIDEAMASLLNRYEGLDTFMTCEISDQGMVTNLEEESCRFPAVTERAEIVLYRVVDGKASVEDYPYCLIRLNEDGDPYMEEC